MDASELTQQLRELRSNIQEFLMTATLPELFKELEISKKSNDHFRAMVIRDTINEREIEVAREESLMAMNTKKPPTFKLTVEIPWDKACAILADHARREHGFSGDVAEAVLFDVKYDEVSHADGHAIRIIFNPPSKPE